MRRNDFNSETVLPSRYWEPEPDENASEREAAEREAEQWIKEHGIPVDPELPFN